MGNGISSATVGPNGSPTRLVPRPPDISLKVLGRSPETGRQLAYRPFKSLDGDLLVIAIEEKRKELLGDAVQMRSSVWREAFLEFINHGHDEEDEDAKEIPYPKDLVFLPYNHNDHASSDDDIVALAKHRHPGLLEVTDRRGNTLLHMAVDRGISDRYLVPALLKSGADPNRPNFDGHTALHRAAMSDCHIWLDELLRHGGDLQIETKDDVGNRVSSPAETVIKSGAVTCIKRMLWDEAFIEALLECRDVKRGERGIHLAARHHSPQVLEVLCRWDDVDSAVAKVGMTPLMAAFTGGMAVKQKTTGTGLMECIDVLIKAGADLKARDVLSQTVLHYAAKSDLRGEFVNRDVIRTLLSAGADPGVASQHGLTAADLARQHGRTKLAELLQNSTKTRLEVIMALRKQSEISGESL